eukprot:766878-Hanusia_phi.AAC.3
MIEHGLVVKGRLLDMLIGREGASVEPCVTSENFGLGNNSSWHHGMYESDHHPIIIVTTCEPWSLPVINIVGSSVVSCRHSDITEAELRHQARAEPGPYTRVARKKPHNVCNWRFCCVWGGNSESWVGVCKIL